MAGVRVRESALVAQWEETGEWVYVQFTPARSGPFLSGVEVLERARVVAQEHMEPGWCIGGVTVIRRVGGAAGELRGHR